MDKVKVLSLKCKKPKMRETTADLTETTLHPYNKNRDIISRVEIDLTTKGTTEMIETEETETTTEEEIVITETTSTTEVIVTIKIVARIVHNARSQGLKTQILTSDCSTNTIPNSINT